MIKLTPLSPKQHEEKKKKEKEKELKTKRNG